MLAYCMSHAIRDQASTRLIFRHISEALRALAVANQRNLFLMGKGITVPVHIYACVETMQFYDYYARLKNGPKS